MNKHPVFSSEMPLTFPLLHQCTLAGLLQTFIESSPIAVVALDAHHRFSAANAAFHGLFGYCADALRSADFDSAITTPGTRDEARRLSAAVLQGKHVRASTKRRRSDGTLVAVEITGIPLLEDGRLAGVYGLYRNSVGTVTTQHDMATISEEVKVLQGQRSQRLDAFQAKETAPAPHLTHREQQLLHLLANGHSSRSIASTLGISVRTVESHRANINQKCGFESLADLVRYVVSQGTVQTA